jgi:hypothetical protein
MNDYIILDGKRYRTGHPEWEPIEDRPMVVKRLLSGATNVTFGPATFTSWSGVIHVDVGAQAPFGTIDDFRATCRKRAVLSFTDHYGNSASVVIDRRVGGRSLSPMWDANDNVWRMNITLLKVS